MANAEKDKSPKSKIATSFRCDPDIYEKAIKKCLRISLNADRRLTLSAKLEELLTQWVETEEQ